METLPSEVLTKIFKLTLNTRKMCDYIKVKTSFASLRLVSKYWKNIIDHMVQYMIGLKFDFIVVALMSDCAHNYEIPSLGYYFDNIIKCYSLKILPHLYEDFIIPIDKCLYCNKYRLISVRSNWCIGYPGCQTWSCIKRPKIYCAACGQENYDKNKTPDENYLLAESFFEQRDKDNPYLSDSD